jgi:L-lactate dehydrogenase complex protein LldE
MNKQTEKSQRNQRVALFATCMVDLMRPNVGFATAKLIGDAGYDVHVPEGQTCCGQPSFNGGDRVGAIKAAEHTIGVLQGFEYVVVPSGSCAAMMKQHYPTLFDTGTPLHKQALELAGRTFELTVFLAEIAGLDEVDGQALGTITYHDSCAGLRELGIQDQPRSLLAKVDGLEVREMDKSDTCCGFGGTFCIKYPEISDRLVERKVEDIEETGASFVVAGDVGCLMNIEGKLHRAGSAVRVCHVAEVLAGMVED